MLTSFPITRLAAAAVLAAGMAAPALAVPAATTGEWYFFQSYGTNHWIAGSFTGTDLNADGVITYSDSSANELNSLTLDYSGPSFIGSFDASQFTIGTLDSNIVEFQYIIGSTNLDALLAGPPAVGSVITLFTPISATASPSNAYLYWTTGSMSFGTSNPYRGYVNIYDDQANILGEYQSSTPTIIDVSAVPEPQTYAMFASGLFVVGAVARRRRAQRPSV